ncbi:MAG: 2-polyprenylphenol 6-hydroxylase [Deltaproteobacteria bacterium]|nr:2-polyprenylphenol 6-hydroxylase [Deltaproteobacteria bacterium]
MSLQTIKNIRRLNKIVRTLIRYGFGGLVGEMRLIPFIGTAERFLLIRKKGRGLSAPQRLRLVLEELGPTFIKLGQIASTRADLLPPDWVEEMKKLQDMVPPFPFEDVRTTVDRSLKAQLCASFASFDPAPVASASIAQVHFAELKDGKKVAVKVRRPGIGAMIEADVSVMRTVAGLLEKYVPVSRQYRPIEVVEEFARVIATEQDLTIEGVNINRFGTLFKGDARVQIPHVYWDYTTAEVLTMERLYGTPIDESETIMGKGLDVRKIAMDGVELFFRQVFEFGVFHADLHPGNIFVRDDGVIIYLDFGIVGRLDRDLRHYLASMLYYLVRQDYCKMAKLHREMGLIGEDVNLSEFEEALRDIAEPIFGRTLEQISVAALLMKLIHTARHFKMVLQPNLLLLQKSMVIIEGVGRQLYPDINMWEVAKPLIYRWMIREKLSPKAFADKGLKEAGEMFEAVFDLPVQTSELMKRALREELKIGFVHHRLDPLINEIGDAGARIGAGFIAGSLVIAATIFAVWAKGQGPGLLGVPALAWVGYGLAVIAALRTQAPTDGKKRHGR